MPTSILAHFSTLLQLAEKRFVYSFQLLCCIYHMLEREQKNEACCSLSGQSKHLAGGCGNQGEVLVPFMAPQRVDFKSNV